MDLRYGGLTLAEYARFCAERERLIEELFGDWVELPNPPPLQLIELCRRHGVEARDEHGSFHPFIEAWEDALGADPWLLDSFSELAGNPNATADDDRDFAPSDSERPSRLELVPARSNGSGTYRRVV